MSSNTSMHWAWSNGSDKIDICAHLRKLVDEEWLSHSDSYKPFLTVTQTFEVEAKAFLKNGHFAADLGNSMPLAMANVLCLLIVVMTDGKFTSIANYSKGLYKMYANFHCLWPVKCRALWCCHPNNTLGAILWGEKSVKCKARVSAVDVDKEQKKEKDIVSCDQFKKRRKCFQGVRSCTDNSHCLGCENPYGKKSIKCTRLEQAQVKEKGGLLRWVRKAYQVESSWWRDHANRSLCNGPLWKNLSFFKLNF